MNNQCKVCRKESAYLNQLDYRDDEGDKRKAMVCDSCWDIIAQIAKNMIEVETNAKFAEIESRLVSIEARL